MSLLALLACAGMPGDTTLESALEVIHQRCFECHAADNVKGGLSLDTVNGWKKSIDLASPGESELLYRLRLPADDVDAMPPKGDRVAEEANAQLEAWIRGGADFTAIEAFLARIAQREAELASSLADLSSAMGASIFEIRTAGNACPSGTLWVSWSHRPLAPSAEEVRQLARVADRTAELSFAGTQITGEVLAALPELPALTRVHLERTRISDNGVATLLQRAPNLRYLNLHSTAVTADLLETVSELGGVQDLILFNTKAATASPAHPFAGIVDFQPRRLLAVDRATGRVVLLREVGLDTYELLWEHDGKGLSNESVPIQWLGGTRSKASEQRKGIDDGHGRVLLQMGPGRFAEFDTRSNERTRELSGASQPQAAASKAGPQRLSSGHLLTLQSRAEEHVKPEEAPGPQLVETDPEGEIIWTFTDVKRFPEGFTCVQVIERTP